MANLKISFQEINSAATQLTSAKEEINSRLLSLQRLIDSLVQSGFVTDRSSVAFQEAYQRFTSGAQNTISGLESLGQYLNSAASILSEIDQQLASKLQA